jgi:hypothetical protein
MSHFDEASKAGFALTYDADKLTNMKITPIQKISNVHVQQENMRNTDTGDFEKYDFEADANLITDDNKETMNKLESVEVKNQEVEEEVHIEEDENHDHEKIDFKNDEFQEQGHEDEVNDQIQNQNGEEDHPFDNFGDTKYEQKNEDENEINHQYNNYQNISNKQVNDKQNEYIKIQNDSQRGTTSSQILPSVNYQNEPPRIISQNRLIDKKVKTNKGSNNDFFFNEDELVR